MLVSDNMKIYSERQQHIIDVSMNLIIDQGMSNLTIRNIAKEINVSEPAIYRHFNSKYDILVALIETIQSTIVPIFSLIGQTENSNDLFTPFLTTLFTTIEKNRASALFVFSEEAFHNEPNLRPQLLNLLSIITTTIEKEFTALEMDTKKQTELSSHDKATITMSLIKFTVTKWHLSNGEIKLTQEIAPLSRLLQTLLC